VTDAVPLELGVMLASDVEVELPLCDEEVDAVHDEVCEGDAEEP